jgi:hypothetical protein
MHKSDLPEPAWDVLAYHYNGTLVKPRQYKKWTAAFLQVGWLRETDGTVSLTLQGRKIWVDRANDMAGQSGSCGRAAHHREAVRLRP